MKVWRKCGGPIVGHLLIARPDKAGAAQRRLAQADIHAMTLPAVMPTRLSEGMGQIGYARFNGGTIPRTPAQHGAGLSHIAALSMGRALQKDWVFLWEEDVEVSPRLKWWPLQSGAGLQEGRGFADAPAFDDGPGLKGDPRLKGGARLKGDPGLKDDPSLRDAPAFEDAPQSNPPAFSDWWFLDAPDLGVIYLGGILWGDADVYGEQIGASELWRVTRGFPISCTHAIGIHARAMNDVIESCSRLDMTADDCVSRACIDATTRGSWSTFFVRPWLAWQIDRSETR